MLSRAREEEDSDSDGNESVATENGEGKVQAVYKVKDLPLQYTREAGNLMTNNFNYKADHVNVGKKAVHVWRKGSSYGVELFLENYNGHCKVPTSHPWSTKEMEGVPQLNPADKLYVSVTSKLERYKCGWFLWSKKALLG